MSQDKLCPECNAEFFPHIIDCPDCCVPLKIPGELVEMEERHREFKEKDAQNAVVIKEGGKNWILELHNLLVEKGYPCSVTTSSNCAPGTCGENFLLIVQKEEAESAANCIVEYIHKVHPEIKESEELAAQGKCPACGFNTGAEANECPDCGLLLLVKGE